MRDTDRVPHRRADTIWVVVLILGYMVAYALVALGVRRLMG